MAHQQDDSAHICPLARQRRWLDSISRAVPPCTEHDGRTEGNGWIFEQCQHLLDFSLCDETAHRTHRSGGTRARGGRGAAGARLGTGPWTGAAARRAGADLGAVPPGAGGGAAEWGGSRSGLGLYISRMIVERHHGQVGVDSVPGQGSTFWFTLPLPHSEQEDH